MNAGTIESKYEEHAMKGDECRRTTVYSGRFVSYRSILYTCVDTRLFIGRYVCRSLDEKKSNISRHGEEGREGEVSLCKYTRYSS